jgi:hypothetical protein
MKIFEIKPMSVLAPIEESLNFGDNILYRDNAIANNPYREDMDADTYSRYLDVYAKVATFYADFFVWYWYKDNVEKTNEKMIEAMGKVGLNNWSGLTEAENNPLGEYVLSLDYPAKVPEIQEFFKRIMAGDLEFLCKYPFDGTNAYDLIKSTGFQI